MTSNNKNKNTKELTLEEIIQKFTFRRSIQNLCVLDKNRNKNQGRVHRIVNAPIQTLNKCPTQLTKIQQFGSKRQYQPNKKSQKLMRNVITARTFFQNKEKARHSFVNQQDKQSSFKAFQQCGKANYKSKKANQKKQNSIQKKVFSKNKIKNKNEYLCVRGGSGSIINCPKPFTADSISRSKIPQYQAKKYETLVNLGSQLQVEQLPSQFMLNQQNIQVKKLNSFMSAKYSTSADIRQKAVSCKGYSTKVKSQMNYSKPKQIYFVPDFIKPSLLIVDNNLQSQKTSAQDVNILNVKQQDKTNTKEQSKTQQVSQCLKGTKFILNPKPCRQQLPVQKYRAKLAQGGNMSQQFNQKQKTQQEGQQSNLSRQMQKSKDSSKRGRQYFCEDQICAWDQNQMGKSRNPMSDHQFDF